MAKQSHYGELLKYIVITLCVGIMVGLFGHIFAPGKVHAETEIQRLWKKIDKLEKDLEETQKATAPVGTIMPYGGSEEPEGWLFCDGRSLERDKYKDLYGVIAANFGAPSNETFSLPDLRGRVPVCAGSAENLTPRTLGEKGGEETHTLKIHEMPKHSHYWLQGRDRDDKGWGRTDDHEYVKKPGLYQGLIGETGGDQPHNNMQPFQVVNYIIKY